MKKIWITGIIPVALIAVVGLSGCGTAATSTTSTTPANTTTVTTTIINNVVPTGSDITSPGKLTADNSSTIIATSQQAGIWVNGTGIVSVTPDIANLNLGVRDQQTTVAAAQANAAAAMVKVMAVLKANNIADKDIQTVQFNISPVSKYDSLKSESYIVGYSVTNIVNVKVRNIDNVGKIIDAAAAAGGNLIVINSISFSVDSPSQYYTKARELAMADAKAKAAQLATLGGVTLGKPIYITESSSNQSYPVYYTKEAAMDSGSTSIGAGETDIVLNVQVTYSIQ